MATATDIDVRVMVEGLSEKWTDLVESAVWRWTLLRQLAWGMALVAVLIGFYIGFLCWMLIAHRASYGGVFIGGAASTLVFVGPMARVLFKLRRVLANQSALEIKAAYDKQRVAEETAREKELLEQRNLLLEQQIDALGQEEGGRALVALLQRLREHDG